MLKLLSSIAISALIVGCGTITGDDHHSTLATVVSETDSCKTFALPIDTNYRITNINLLISDECRGHPCEYWSCYTEFDQDNFEISFDGSAMYFSNYGKLDVIDVRLETVKKKN